MYMIWKYLILRQRVQKLEHTLIIYFIDLKQLKLYFVPLVKKLEQNFIFS